MSIDMSAGYVAVPRGLTSWEWYDDPNTCRLYIHLLLTVNWEPKEWRGITVEAGSRVASISILSKETGLSIQQARTCLDRLKSTGYVTSKNTNKYSVFTVKNWSEMAGDNKQNNKQATSKQQASNNNQTIKPLNQDNNISPPPTPSSGAGPEKKTTAATKSPEDYWRGCGYRLTLPAREAFQGWREKGMEDELIITAIREAGVHEAKSPLAYIRPILDRAAAAGQLTLAAWQAAHPPGCSPGGKRVDRPEPSGNDFLADAVNRPRRHKRQD